MTADASSLPQSAPRAERETRAERRVRAPAANASHIGGMLWFGGWLFTIGFAELVWWKALLGLVLWPYFLGATVR